MATLYQREPNFKEIAKRENNFNYSVASLGDIYRPYLTTKQQQRQYDILSEEEMIARGIIKGRPNFSYKKNNKVYSPPDPNLKNVNINQVDLGKGMSHNIQLNQGKPQGKLKGHKIAAQRPTSAISTKKIKYNQDLDPAQRNRIIDVNYLHITKLPESKKFSHVDKAIINPVQSTFSVKNIVDDNIKKHEKMMKPIVLYPDQVKIYNKEFEKILPGEEGRKQRNKNRTQNSNYMTDKEIVIGEATLMNKTNKTNKPQKDNHVIFNNPKANRFRRKATSTKAARNTLRDSEKFVQALEDYFLSLDMKVPPQNDIHKILNIYAQKLDNSLNKFENQISGKKYMNTDISRFLYQNAFGDKQKGGLGAKVIKPRGPKVYPEIDYEFKKKIQERLSRLQINLRQIFDNISMLKKNKTKENVQKIDEQIKKARELTYYLRHLADDVKTGEEEFKNSFQRPKSSSPQKKRVKNINNNISTINNNIFSQSMDNLNSSFPSNQNSMTYNNVNNNMNLNTINNNFNNTSNNNIGNDNPPQGKTQTNQNPQVENPLEYSSTSIGSNINPMNSFSSNINTNINKLPNNSTVSQTQPQMQSTNNMMNSKTNLYIQSKNFNPIMEDPNEEINNNTRSVTSSQRPTNNIGNTKLSMSNASLKNSKNVLNNSNALKNTQKLPNKSVKNPNPSQSQNANYFLSNTSVSKEFIPKASKTMTNTNKMSQNQNPLLSNSMTKSKMIKVSLAEPEYFKNRPTTNSQTFHGSTSISLINPKSSEILTQNHVINNIDQTINHVPMKAEEMKVNTHNYIEDERYSAFNVEFPVNYYYELTKEHEPPKNKEWFIRPHHTETFVESNYAIPDDIMNTKYISYYAPASTEKKKTRQDIIEELIMETRSHINELQEDMFKKANMNSEGEKLYNKLEGLKEEAKNSFVPGLREAQEAKQKSIFEMLKDPNSGASYTEMFDQNDDIKQTNFAISSLGTMLSELRDKERNLINMKRKEEYERIRPPIDRWYELKTDNFLNEIIRNKMVLNSGPEYFEKIEELQNEELY